MRLLLQSAMIFFGTLLAAGLLALGKPYAAAAAAAAQKGGEHSVLLVLEGSWRDQAAPAPR